MSLLVQGDSIKWVGQGEGGEQWLSFRIVARPPELGGAVVAVQHGPGVATIAPVECRYLARQLSRLAGRAQIRPYRRRRKKGVSDDGEEEGDQGLASEGERSG